VTRRLRPVPSGRAAPASAAPSAGEFGPRAARCPRCGAAVLLSAAGRALEPLPHPLGVLLPGGGALTARQAADAATGRTAPIGHHPHSTAPGYGCRTAPAQLALFAC